MKARTKTPTYIFFETMEKAKAFMSRIVLTYPHGELKYYKNTKIIPCPQNNNFKVVYYQFF